jgi:hypothetical protein
VSSAAEQRPAAAGALAEVGADGDVPVRDGAAGDEDDEAATAVVAPAAPVPVGAAVPVPEAGGVAVPVPVRAAGDERCVDALLGAPAAALGPAAVTEARNEQPATASSRTRPRIVGALRDGEVVTFPR